jgi:fucose 4-O-acetylase-like acetyltransferase
MLRRSWVDLAKAIGVILVVYGHSARGLYKAGLISNEPLYAIVDSVIYTFHMPLFFFLAGLFFLNSISSKGWQIFVFGKLDSIIYPYVLWTLIQGSVEVVLSKYTNGNRTWADVFSLAWHPIGQFWFLYVLFFCFIFSIAIYRRLAKKYYPVVVVVFGVLYLVRGYIFQSASVPDLFFANMVFFVAGVWFSGLKQGEGEAGSLGLVFWLVCFLLAQYFFHLSYTFNVISLWTLILSFVSMGFIVYFSMWLSQFSLGWLQFIGVSSMTIYLMHILAASGARVALKKFGVDSSAIHLVAGLLAGVALPLLAQFFIGKFNLTFLLVRPGVGRVKN